MYLFSGSKKKILTAGLLCLLACLGQLGGTAEAKADRYFVDYEQNTGYYVDVNSIELPSEHEVELDLYLIKLHSKYMYRYRAHFDTEEISYEYQNAKIYNYETKELMTGSNMAQAKLSYSKNQMLQEVIDFALDWKKTHIHKTQYGETWE